MEKINVYTLGYRSEEILEKIKAILKSLVYESPNKKNNNHRINFDFSNFFKWFNSSLDNTIEKISEIVNKSQINDKFREIIVYSFENFENHKNNIEKLFESYDSNKYFQPFFICIYNNTNELEKIKNGISEKIKYFFEKEENEKEIYIRNFSYLKLNLEDENKPMNIDSEEIKKEIIKKFIRIYSYYNELGDSFFDVLQKQNSILENNKEENKYRINILCIGKSQRGKSSFINLLLKDKRSKEGGTGTKCTNKINKYKADDAPLNVYDTIGVSSDKNGEIVAELISKIDELQIQLKGEMLHLILYFLDYNDEHIFDPKELEIFKKLCNGYIKAHYIFVCTKFCEVNSCSHRSDKAIQKLIENHMKKVRNSLKTLCENQTIDIIINEDENRNKEKTIKMSIIDYLYCCQEGIEINNFKNGIEDDIKLAKIINYEKNIAYINTIKCIKNGCKTEIYGIKNICNKIIDILKIIEKENIKIYKKILKKTSSNENELQPILPVLELEEENMPLTNDFFFDKNNIDNVLNQLEDKAHKEVKKYEIGSGLFGILPVIDLIAQHFLKKYAIKKIADIFEDNLIEIKIQKNTKEINEEEKNLDELLIKQTQDNINDLKSDITKTTIRMVTITNDVLHLLTYLGKVSIDFFLKIGIKVIGGVLCAGGLALGITIGFYVMISDIKEIINFYKERLKSKMFTIELFSEVINYFNHIG